MIIAVDIETYKQTEDGWLEPVLDSKQFKLGCLIKETAPTRPEYFTNPKDMWERIKDIAIKEEARKHQVQIYGHSHQYDFYGYANMIDNVSFFSHSPFIASWTNPKTGNESIRFLDTYAIFKMSLKKLGELIQHKKLEMPEKVFSTGQLKEYVTRDTEIVLKAILWLKNKIKEEGISIRRIHTISQVAIQALLNQLKKSPYKDWIFDNPSRNKIHETINKILIHKAYRGGRVEAFKTGWIDSVNYYDINSLYPYAATQIEFPDLLTERYTERTELSALNKIGVTRALVKNVSNKIGLLAIRTKTGGYYPKPGQWALGTWTNKELKVAQQNGYDIEQLGEGVTYETLQENPLKDIYEDFYRRKTRGDAWNKFFWKSIMNHSIGKLGQYKLKQEFVYDSVEKTEEYLKKGYEAVHGHGLNYLFRGEQQRYGLKPYYCPILPSIINAEARIIMWKYLKEIPSEKLIYTDTDSIIVKSDIELPIGLELGELKQEYNQEKMLIYGKKTYIIGEEMKISGIRKRDVKKEDFEQGEINSVKMVTVANPHKGKVPGNFITETRNLKKQHQEHIKSEELLKETVILIDDDLEDIAKFIPTLSKVLPV